MRWTNFRLTLPLCVTFYVCVSAQPASAQNQVFPNDPESNLFRVTELSPTVYVDEVGSATKGQIDRINQFGENGQWNEALEMLRRLEDQGDGGLVSNPNGNPQYPHFLPLRGWVQVYLKKLSVESPETFQAYHRAVEPLVRNKFRQSVNVRDVESLRRIVQEHFHSSTTKDALLWLGDHALEAAKYDQARTYWRQIDERLQWSNKRTPLPVHIRVFRGESVEDVASDLASHSSDASVSTDEDTLPKLWARFVLASILEGSERRAAAELSILNFRWPKERGMLGGRDVILSSSLDQLLSASKRWPQEPQRSSWQTFAGNERRSPSSSVEIDLPMRPAWQTSLIPIPKPNRNDAGNRSLPAKELVAANGEVAGYFPVVVDGRVIISEPNRMRCLDVTSGQSAWRSGDDGVFFEIAPPADNEIRFSQFGAKAARTPLGEKRFTVAANEQVAVATITSNDAVGSSSLVGFDLSKEGSIRFGPVELEQEMYSYHGAPIVVENRCWVGIRKQGNSAQDSIACIDTRTGRQVWQTRICSADTIANGGRMEVSGTMLTRHEDSIFYTSHLGTVASVAAKDGRIQWITQYPRSGPKKDNLLNEPWHVLRDPAPCFYYDELLVVMPSDSRKLFALSAQTGELIWETEVPSDATQILGVGRYEQLILGGRRLWWLDIYTGRVSRKAKVNPFPAVTLSEPVGYGRGILTGGNIYWPVLEGGSSKIYVLRQSDGQPTRQPIDLDARGCEAGNLFMAPPHLLIAGPKQLSVFQLPN